MRRCWREDGRRSPGNCCGAIRNIARSLLALIRAVTVRHGGGSTFAADPVLSCAQADYMWTAAADPYVLRARVFRLDGQAGHAIDLSRLARCSWPHDGCDHIRLTLPDGDMRLDLVEGVVVPGPMTIAPTVDLRCLLEPQLKSIRRLDALIRGDRSPLRDQRFVRLVEALRAADALMAGASLREIALGALGDDWPGDGEHLKSRVRRRVALAAELTRAGPRTVLARRI